MAARGPNVAQKQPSSDPACSSARKAEKSRVNLASPSELPSKITRAVVRECNTQGSLATFDPQCSSLLSPKKVCTKVAVKNKSFNLGKKIAYLV